MPARKGNMSKKLKSINKMWRLIKLQLSFHDVRNDHKCSDIKATMASANPRDKQCQLLKV